MYNVLLGIIFSFIYAVLVIVSTFSNDKRRMTKIQTVDQMFCALSNLFLNSYSATVVNIISTIRNYLTSKGRLTKFLSFLCILFYVVLGILFNTRGWIGIFPIAASSIYTIFCLKSKSSQTLRYGLIINLTLWLIHDIFVKAYPSIIMEILVIIFTIYNIIKYAKKYKMN